jgi:hypothetical protein
MKRFLWVSIVLCGFLPINGQQKTAQANTGENAPDGSSSPVSVTVIDQPTSKEQTETPKQEPKSYLGTLISANNLPSLLLVAVGVGAIVFAWKTVDATRDAAKAALLNAQAVINSERAWMIPKIVQPANHGPIMSPSSTRNDPPIKIKLTIANQGKTPAIGTRALNGYCSVEIVDPQSQSWTLELPQIPDYSGVRGGKIVPQAPGSVYVSGEGSELSIDQIDKDFCLAESRAWARKEKCLCIMGYYEYLDVFGRTRITRFCYAYQDVSQIDSSGGTQYRFRKAGPDAYNEIT